MDYGGNWEIYHRDEDEMLSLLPDGYEADIKLDSTNTNMYLIARV